MLNITPKQPEFEFVYLEQLIPQDHLLRKINAVLDFEFIREEVKHLYCENNGRPCIDPVILFKILFMGYFYGVRSERQLIREIELNLAYGGCAECFVMPSQQKRVRAPLTFLCCSKKLFEEK